MVVLKKRKQYRYLFAESDTMKILRLYTQVFDINNCHRYEKIVFHLSVVVCSVIMITNNVVFNGTDTYY